MMPTRSIFSIEFFNQNQEFFIARRSENRRVRDIAPYQLSLSNNELFYLMQYALMDGRILDNALASIGLCFAGLELRLDQRDDLTGRAQQCNDGRKNFAQGNEGTIDDDKINRVKGLREGIRCQFT